MESFAIFVCHHLGIFPPYGGGNLLIFNELPLHMKCMNKF